MAAGCGFVEARAKGGDAGFGSTTRAYVNGLLLDTVVGWPEWRLESSFFMSGVGGFVWFVFDWEQHCD